MRQGYVGTGNFRSGTVYGLYGRYYLHVYNSSFDTIGSIWNEQRNGQGYGPPGTYPCLRVPAASGPFRGSLWRHRPGSGLETMAPPSERLVPQGADYVAL